VPVVLDIAQAAGGALPVLVSCTLSITTGRLLVFWIVTPNLL
jgi:hypothetical protein